MTREEEKQKALEIVRQELLDRGDEVVSFRQLVERFDGIEKVYKGIPWTLEQIYTNFNILIGKEPCTDCISRQAAFDALENIGSLDTEADREYARNFFEALPPVIPAEKAGHWIEKADEYYKAINEKGGGVTNTTPYFVDDIACSECLTMFSTIDNETERFEFCPNCGAKMQ